MVFLSFLAKTSPHSKIKETTKREGLCTGDFVESSTVGGLLCRDRDLYCVIQKLVAWNRTVFSNWAACNSVIYLIHMTTLFFATSCLWWSVLFCCSLTISCWGPNLSPWTVWWPSSTPFWKRLWHPLLISTLRLIDLCNGQHGFFCLCKGLQTCSPSLLSKTRCIRSHYPRIVLENKISGGGRKMRGSHFISRGPVFRRGNICNPPNPSWTHLLMWVLSELIE